MVFTPFLTLILAGMLARLGYQMARSPVLPRFAQDLGAGPELAGLIIGASTITGVLFKLPAGGLSDLLGRRRMMLLGCAFFAGPPFLYPLVHDPLALLVLRFVHGLATAIFSPVASAVVAIAGACFVLASRAIIDLSTLPMGLVTLAILTHFEVPEPVVITAAGALGVLIFWTTG